MSIKGKTKFSITEQRKAILESLRSVRSHPTADEIFTMVRKSLPRVSLGTVYRNLEKMCRNGLIKKIELPGLRKRYEGGANNHYHVRCSQCGTIDDLHGIHFSDLENVGRHINGYRIDGYRLELTGVCPQCLKRRLKRRKNKYN